MKFDEYRFDEITLNYDKERIPLSAMERGKRQGKYRYYGAQGIIDYVNDYIFDGKYLLIAEDGENLKSKKQNIAQIVEGQFWVNNHAHIVKCNEKCILEYLAYIMNCKDISGYITGSAQPKLSQANLKAMTFNIPPVAYQKKCLNVLLPIEHKIKLNTTINNNLEQQAIALYENTFCTPSNIAMKHISLSDLMDYSGGSQPPASKFIFMKRDGYIRFVQIRDYDTDSHITYIPESAKNKLCEEHDIMIARYGASLGRICFGINGAYNVALAKVFPKKSYFREFLRCYLSSRTFYEGINNKGGRSAQAGFNQSDINSFELDFPIDEAIVQKFESTVAPMFEQRLQLRKENQRLASLRDTLLPKLMSGEFDVSDIDI